MHLFFFSFTFIIIIIIKFSILSSWQWCAATIVIRKWRLSDACEQWQWEKRNRIVWMKCEKTNTCDVTELTNLCRHALYFAFFNLKYTDHYKGCGRDKNKWWLTLNDKRGELPHFITDKYTMKMQSPARLHQKIVKFISHIYMHEWVPKSFIF